MKTYNGDELFYECPHCGGRIPTDWDALDYGGCDFAEGYTEYFFDCACGKQIRILDVDGTVEVWGQGE